jgi:hypothetical protein
LLSISLIAVVSQESPTNGYEVIPILSIDTDQPAYAGNATIVVSGKITQVEGDPIMVIITNPSGTPIASNYVTTDEYSGMYQTEFKAGGPGWTESGTYNVTASWQFCPASALKSTTFKYSAIARTSFGATLSTRSVTTVTPCYTAQSMTAIGATSVPTSSGQLASPDAVVVGSAALAMLVLLATLFARRASVQKGSTQSLEERDLTNA